jgi:hypothetical protein
MALTPNLASYTAVQSNLFVRIQVDEYRTTSSGSYTPVVLKFSDSLTTRTINEEEYLPLGSLMSVSSSSSELRVSGGSLNISISGIPNSSISEIVNSKIKGCPVRIYRLFSNPTTGEIIDTPGNPSGRYRGFINNFSLTEELDNETRTATNTITLVCASSVDVLQNKISGRKTNPSSQKKFFPSDLSMDRVPNLENATFNFGAPT